MSLLLFKKVGITIGLTEKCNLKCVHCLRQASPNTGVDLPIYLLTKVLKEARELEVQHVALTGGEVGLHKDFDKAIDLIVKNGHTFSIVTNGNQPDYYTDILNTYRNNILTFIAVSVDGATSETYQYIRGGDFEAACNSLQIFVQKGYRTKMAFCVNRINYKEFDDLIQLAINLHVPEVNVSGLIEFDFNSNLSLSPEEKNKIIEMCRFINKNYKNIKVNMTTSLGAMDTISPVVDFCNNIASFNPFIRPNGDCDYCCDAERTLLGSIKNTSLIELAKRHLEFSNYMRMDRYKRITEGNHENISVCNYCIATYKKFIAEKKYVESK